MSSLWQEYQGSSPVTKVVAAVLAVGIVVALCCVGAMGAFFLYNLTQQEEVTAQVTPTVIVVAPAPPLTTPNPTPSVFTDWRGEYYDNPDLAGEPVLVRDDPQIDFDWGANPPAPGVPAENFSVRWTISRELEAGVYRINIRVDNGVRLWIDDVLIVDQWVELEIRTVSADVNLIAGPHDIRLEYFHSTGYALVQGTADYLQNFPDWKAEYFNNPALAEAPVLVRNEQAIHYNWGSTSPVPGVVNDNNFSIRWTRTPHFDTDKYIFRVSVEGRVRIWLDGQILIDSWDQTTFRQLETTKDMSVGNHGLRVEYAKETGNGQIIFGWAELDDPGEPPLAVISGPARAVVSQPVNFSARNSSVAEGSHLVTFDWDFGDGATGSGIDVTHVYNAVGKFTVSLKVTDDKGLSDTSSQQIEIVAAPVTPQPGQPPVAVIVAPSQARVGDTIPFDASQSLCSSPCVSFAWDFGDGRQANAIRVQHVYLAAGDFNVTLTVTDNTGLQGTSNTVIRIRQTAATATPVPPTNTPVGPTATSTSGPPPVDTPTLVPTDIPTDVPTEVPPEVPTEVPPEVPTEVPPEVPTEVPPEVPTEVPPEVPTEVPTEEPPEVPTEVPPEVPTEVPPEVPTEVPPEVPTETPTPTLEAEPPIDPNITTPEP